MRAWWLVGLLSACALAADWPRFGGPTGDFVTGEELHWPAGGPKLLWKHPLGDGFSSIVSDGRLLYTMLRRGGQEVVVCLDAGTGVRQWEHAYDAPLPANFDQANTIGPRAAPLISGKVLFTAGATGRIHALDLLSGKVLWARDPVKEFHGEVRNNGYTASPMVWKDMVIVFPFAKGAAVAALRVSDGSVVWKRHDYVLSYAAGPMMIRAKGRDQMVMQFSEEVVGMDPDDGAVLWSQPHTNSEKVSVAMPVWDNGLLFVSSAYDGGSQALRLSLDDKGWKAEQVWAHRQVRIHHSDAVRIGGTVYAASGDLGACPLAAVELASGKLLWRDRTFAKASLLVTGKQLLILDEDGNLALATPNEKGLEVHGKVQAMEATSWTPPAVVGTRVYLRDHHNIAAYSFE